MAGSRRVRGWTAIAAGALLCAPTDSLEAQAVDGRLLDESSNRPVPGAILLLFDSTGSVVRQALSDGAGRFELRGDTEGVHWLRAIRFGYRTVTSPPLRLDTEHPLPVDLLVQPKPLELPGLKVTARRLETDLHRLGIRPEQLGRRLVTRDAIERRSTARDVGHILSSQGVAGVRVIRAENDFTKEGSPLTLCVALSRARRFDSGTQCARFVVDGVLVHPSVAALVDPRDIEAIVLLTATEATTLLGTGSYGGAVLIYTRRGGG